MFLKISSLREHLLEGDLRQVAPKEEPLLVEIVHEDISTRTEAELAVLPRLLKAAGEATNLPVVAWFRGIRIPQAIKNTWHNARCSNVTFCSTEE